MADTLMLRKGLLANLANAPIVNGAIDITVDERAMYVCHDGQRVRLGDFIEVATVDDLKALEAEWRTSALYYVVESNALLKYNKNGTENEIGSGTNYQWVQINEVSDLAADISGLQQDVDNAEQNITALQTAYAGINIELTGDVVGSATISDNKLNVTTDISSTGVDAQDYGPEKDATVNHGGTIIVPNFTVAADGRLTAAGSIEYTLPSVNDITENITTLQGAVQTNIDNIADIKAEIGVNTDGSETGIYKYAKDQVAVALNSAEGYADKAKEDAVKTAKEYADTEVKKVNDVVDGHTTSISSLQAAHTAINIVLTGDVAGTATIDTDNKLEVEDIKIQSTGVVANTYGNTKDSDSVDHGGSIAVPRFTVAADGRLTAAGITTYTLPNVDSITGDITTLQGAVQANTENISKNVTAIENEAKAARDAEKALGDRIDQEITNRGDAISSVVNTLNGTINGVADRVTTAEGNITNLQSVIGTKKTDISEATGIYKYIEDQDAATLIAAEGKISTALAAADAMTFKGVVGTEDGHIALPDAGNKGDTYKVGTKGTYAGYTCYVGDLLICKGDNSNEWWHVSSGYEDDYDPYLSATGNTITLKNTVGAAKGAITVQGDYIGIADANGAIAGGTQIIASNSTDPSTGISNIVYTVSTVWGSF